MAFSCRTVESKSFSTALTREFLRAVHDGDAHALATGYYARDARILPPNQPIVKGRRAILKYWRMLFAEGLREIKLKTLHLDVSGNLAYEVGEWRIGRVTGKHLLVYRKRHGLWRVEADMMSRNDRAA